jgi:3-(3-hydroxy-phenyl)propionate hydroxylase
VALALNAIPPIKRYFVQMRFKPMPRFTSGIVIQTQSGSVQGRATGKLFPQPRVSSADGKISRLDDVIGLRFAILSWGTDPQLHMSDELRRYWGSIDAAFVALIPPTQIKDFRGNILPGTIVIGDTDGALHEWFADQGDDGSIVVLRPDRVVAGIVPPQKLEQASRTLRGLIGDTCVEGAVGAASPQAALAS